MATAPSPISLDDYMNTSYSPDCEYIDGLVIERNVGKGKHSYTQLQLGHKLIELCEPKGLVVLTEQRTRVAEYRVRIPDVSVVEELEDVTNKPPRLCVEVLSPDDRWRRVTLCIGDYQEMGVPCVWVVDPFQRRAWIFDADQPPVEVQDGMLRAEELGVEIKLADVLPPTN
ncbi:MAG: Uma2 family endonuclease [Acidobacteriota bacterium]|nr:Uma2 family endonuclease [Acidobacteriota bacterium]